MRVAQKDMSREDFFFVHFGNMQYQQSQSPMSLTMHHLNNRNVHQRAGIALAGYSYSWRQVAVPKSHPLIVHHGVLMEATQNQ